MSTMSGCATRRSSGRGRPGSDPRIAMPIWRQLCCPSCSTATSGLGTTTVSPGPAPLDSLRARSASYDATVAALERAGLPVVDHIRGTLPVTTEAVEPGYRTLVEELPAGVTHFALHCTAPG